MSRGPCRDLINSAHRWLGASSLTGQVETLAADHDAASASLRRPSPPRLQPSLSRGGGRGAGRRHTRKSRGLIPRATAVGAGSSAFLLRLSTSRRLASVYILQNKAKFLLFECPAVYGVLFNGRPRCLCRLVNNRLKY